MSKCILQGSVIPLPLNMRFTAGHSLFSHPTQYEFTLKALQSTQASPENTDFRARFAVTDTQSTVPKCGHELLRSNEFICRGKPVQRKGGHGPLGGQRTCVISFSRVVLALTYLLAQRPPSIAPPSRVATTKAQPRCARFHRGGCSHGANPRHILSPYTNMPTRFDTSLAGYKGARS